MGEFLFTDRAVRRVAEDKIAAAMDAGAFDKLPGAGKPIADLDRTYDANWWVRRWIERERLTDELRGCDRERALAAAAVLDLLRGMKGPI